MPKITINHKEYEYDETDVISFAEGLIGLPQLRRAVLIALDDFQPFCWMASLDDEKNRFIVVDPHLIYSGYDPALPADLKNQSAENQWELWTIVKISSDWQKTTVNLRAPLFVNRERRSGAQIILSESRFGHAETLPGN
jgi:flagellar assembly factor FliW